MIVNALLELIYNLFALLTLPINIPSLPDGVSSAISKLSEYLASGYAILDNFFDMSYLISLFAIVLAVDIGILLYKFVMWVLKKIPMINIS